jgi:hypothetical protein
MTENGVTRDVHMTYQDVLHFQNVTRFHGTLVNKLIHDNIKSTAVPEAIFVKLTHYFVLFLVIEHRWNEIDRGNLKYSEKNLSQCYLVHHKSHGD